MSVRRNNEEVRRIVCDLGYDLLEEYVSEKGSRKIIIRDREGYEYDTYLSKLINSDQGLHIVDSRSPLKTLKNIQLWLFINKPEIELCVSNETYLGAHKKLTFYHNASKCQETFEASWHQIHSLNSNCSVCEGRQVGKCNTVAYLRPDLVLEWHPKNILTPKDVTVSSAKKIYWVCLGCGYGENKEWFVSPNDRTGKECSCPKCSSSKGEKKIETFLRTNNIDYVFQKKFSDCRNLLALPFDFGIPLKNKKWLLIEYQGKQHFQPIGFFGGKKQFALQRRLDKIKENYCKDNNISLLTIPYWKFNEIENILSEIFK